MATDLTKTIAFRIKLEEARKDVEAFRRQLAQLKPSDDAFKPTVAQLVKAEKILENLNNKVKEQRKHEQEVNDLLERRKKTIADIAKFRANQISTRQQQNFDNFRQGLDIGRGFSEFASQPFSFLTGKIQRSANKRFDEFIEGNQYEMQANEAEMTQNQKRIDELNNKKKLSKKEKDELATLSDRNKELGDKNQNLKNANAKAAIAQAAMNTVANGLKTLAKPLNDFKDSVVQAVKALINMKSGVATYSSSSLITNASARETKLKYGMNDSQAYGFTQAKSLLNISSDEDLMYMKQEQRDRLLSYMEKYSNWYSEMESSGVLQNIQEMQLEFEMFKQEIAMEFLQWVSENKDTIMTCIKGIFNFIKGIATLVMNIIKIISWGTADTSSAFESDSWNSGATTNNNQKTNNININANVTNNGLSGSSGIDTTNDQMWSDLAKQIVAATE